MANSLLAQVKTLKERIHTLKGGDYPVEGQKLIYSGKILVDETALKEYSIDESKFIVVMVSKPKPPPPVSAAAPPAVATTKTESSTPAAPAATTPAATTPKPETGNAPSTPATG